MDNTAKLTRQFLRLADSADLWDVLAALRAAEVVVETRILRENTTFSGRPAWQPDFKGLKNGQDKKDR